MGTAVLGSKLGAQLQGVATPISTILRAVTGNCDPDVSICLPYFSVFYKTCHAVAVDFAMVTEHRQFSSMITWSHTVFCQSQIVTLVSALSTVHIGVTIPLLRSITDFSITSFGGGWGQGFPFWYEIHLSNFRLAGQSPNTIHCCRKQPSPDPGNPRSC